MCEKERNILKFPRCSVGVEKIFSLLLRHFLSDRKIYFVLHAKHFSAGIGELASKPIKFKTAILHVCRREHLIISDAVLDVISLRQIDSLANCDAKDRQICSMRFALCSFFSGLGEAIKNILKLPFYCSNVLLFANVCVDKNSQRDDWLG